MIIRVVAYDGKEFKGLDVDKLVKECNAYESDLRLKAEKEEAERKAKEEIHKKMVAERNAERDVIRVKAEEFLKLQNDYNEKHNVQLFVGNSNGRVIIKDINSFGDLLDSILT